MFRFVPIILIVNEYEFAVEIVEDKDAVTPGVLTLAKLKLPI